MFRVLIVLILLTACAPSDRNMRTYDDRTQMAQTVSRDAEVFRDGPDHINARAIILEKRGVQQHYLSMTILRGGPNGPRVIAMTQAGKPLDYQRHDRLAADCIDGCHKAEIGAITLSCPAFLDAAKTGMQVFIEGRRRNYTAVIPAGIFVQALAANGQSTP